MRAFTLYPEYIYIMRVLYPAHPHEFFWVVLVLIHVSKLGNVTYLPPHLCGTVINVMLFIAYRMI